MATPGSKSGEFYPVDISKFDHPYAVWSKFFPYGRGWFPMRSEASRRVIYMEDYAHLLSCVLQRVRVINRKPLASDPVVISDLHTLEEISPQMIQDAMAELLAYPPIGGASGAVMDKGFIVKSDFASRFNAIKDKAFKSMNEVREFLRSVAHFDESFNAESRNISVEKAADFADWYRRLMEMGYLATPAKNNLIPTTGLAFKEAIISGSYSPPYYKETVGEERSEIVTMSELLLRRSFDTTVLSVSDDNKESYYQTLNYPMIGNDRDCLVYGIILTAIGGYDALGNIINNDNREYWLTLYPEDKNYGRFPNVYRSNIQTKYGFPDHASGMRAFVEKWHNKSSMPGSMYFRAVSSLIGYIENDICLSRIANVLNYSTSDRNVWD